MAPGGMGESLWFSSFSAKENVKGPTPGVFCSLGLGGERVWVHFSFAFQTSSVQLAWKRPRFSQARGCELCEFLLPHTLPVTARPETVILGSWKDGRTSLFFYVLQRGF